MISAAVSAQVDTVSTEHLAAVKAAAFRQLERSARPEDVYTAVLQGCKTAVDVTNALYQAHRERKLSMQLVLEAFELLGRLSRADPRFYDEQWRVDVSVLLERAIAEWLKVPSGVRAGSSHPGIAIDVGAVVRLAQGLRTVEVVTPGLSRLFADMCSLYAHSMNQQVAMRPAVSLECA